MESRLKAGSARASMAVMITGRYWGLHPAMTAFTAIRSTVASPCRGGRTATTSSGSRSAQRMRDEGKRQIGQAAIPGFEFGQLLELECPHHDGRNAVLLEHDGAVDTPRRARPSVRAPDQDEVALREIGHDRRRRRPGNTLFALDDVADAIALLQACHHGQHQRARVGLAVVENTRALALETGQARSQAGGEDPRLG